MYPLLGEFGAIEKTVITVLAVAGGFVFGFIGTGFLTRWVSKTNQTRPAKVAKAGGGTAAAVAVYMLLGGDGGMGLGGKGGADPSNNNEGRSSEVVKTPLKVENPTPKAGEVRKGEMDIFVLSAASTGGKFFRIGEEALTLDEVMNRVEETEHSDATRLAVIRIKVGDPDYGVPPSQRLYTRLNEFKRGRNLAIDELQEQGP